MAKLAEQAERYEEMVEYMKKVAQGKQEEMLSLEVRRASRISSLLSPGAASPSAHPSTKPGQERNLLSVAYKNVVGARCGRAPRGHAGACSP